MRTTLDIPDAIFRRAKSAAAERGIPLREVVTEALAERLHVHDATEKPWMASFGKLRNLRTETFRVNQILEREFGQIDPEGWR